MPVAPATITATAVAYRTALLIVVAVVVASVAGMVLAARSAAATLKTPAPCSTVQTFVGVVSEIQPRKNGLNAPVIPVRASVTCRVVQVAGGYASDYRVRLIGTRGLKAGKALSVAVGQAWLVGDGNLRYTKLRVIEGYPKRTWAI